MKRIFIILSLASFLLFDGCEDDRLKLPKAHISPQQLALTSAILNQKIVLSIVAPTPIKWAVTYKPNWLSVFPESGTIGSVDIDVIAHASTLLPGKLSDKIVITTATEIIELPVTLDLTTTDAVQISPSNLLVEYDQSSLQLNINNHSNQAVNWQIESSSSFIKVTPSSGTLNANQSSTLTLDVDRTNLETNIYSEKLILKLGGIKTAEALVTVKHYNEEKWLLDGAITDAEYDRLGDNMIVIIDDKLYKIKPETRTIASVALPKRGACVSVSKDGKYAVVGHFYAISVIDLTLMKVDKTYETSVDAFDVVLAPNNWVYVDQRYYGWHYMGCINLSDGSEEFHSGNQIWRGTTIKLHPSGDYIYGIRNEPFPANAEKYDVRGGKANYLYASQYASAQHEFGYNLWFDENGSRMFTNEGEVFKLSSVQSSDLIYDQSIAYDNFVLNSVDHIASKNLVGAVYYNSSSQSRQGIVRFLSGNQLNVVETKTLPPFLMGQPGAYQAVASEGFYGFFNSTGTKFFVCVRSISAQWAIATIDVN